MNEQKAFYFSFVIFIEELQGFGYKHSVFYTTIFKHPYFKMKKIFCIFVAVLVFVCECTELEMLEDDYELIDGISVPRKGKVIRHKGKEKDDKGDTDDDNYEDEITEDDAPEEDVELTKDLPAKCHGKLRDRRLECLQ
jgi:hypothetical protein